MPLKIRGENFHEWFQFREIRESFPLYSIMLVRATNSVTTIPSGPLLASITDKLIFKNFVDFEA